MLEGADKDECAGVNISREAAENLHLGESDVCIHFNVSPGQFSEKTLHVHCVRWNEEALMDRKEPRGIIIGTCFQCML